MAYGKIECVACGAPNPADNFLCNQCGKQIRPQPEKKLQEPEEPEEPEDYICSICGKHIDETYSAGEIKGLCIDCYHAQLEKQKQMEKSMLLDDLSRDEKGNPVGAVPDLAIDEDNQDKEETNVQKEEQDQESKNNEEEENDDSNEEENDDTNESENTQNEEENEEEENNDTNEEENEDDSDDENEDFTDKETQSQLQDKGRSSSGVQKKHIDADRLAILWPTIPLKARNDFTKELVRDPKMKVIVSAVNAVASVLGVPDIIGLILKIITNGFIVTTVYVVSFFKTGQGIHMKAELNRILDIPKVQKELQNLIYGGIAAKKGSKEISKDKK